MHTVKEYCQKLGWTPTDLSREAVIALFTANKAMEGKFVADRSKQKIVKALSSALNQQIFVGDIQWGTEADI